MHEQIRTTPSARFVSTQAVIGLGPCPTAPPRAPSSSPAHRAASARRSRSSTARAARTSRSSRDAKPSSRGVAAQVRGARRPRDRHPVRRRERRGRLRRREARRGGARGARHGHRQRGRRLERARLARSSGQTSRGLIDVNVRGALATLSPRSRSCSRSSAATSSACRASRASARSPTSGAYSASKAALSTFLETLRLDLRARGHPRHRRAAGLRRDADQRERQPPDAVPLARSDKAARVIANRLERAPAVVSFPWPLVCSTSLLRELARLAVRPVGQGVAAVGFRDLQQRTSALHALRAKQRVVERLPLRREPRAPDPDDLPSRPLPRRLVHPDRLAVQPTPTRARRVALQLRPRPLGSNGAVVVEVRPVVEPPERARRAIRVASHSSSPGRARCS